MSTDLVLAAALIAGIATIGLIYMAASVWLDRRHRTHFPLPATEACALDLHDRCLKDWCTCSCHGEPLPLTWVNDGRPPARRCRWPRPHTDRRERCTS